MSQPLKPGRRAKIRSSAQRARAWKLGWERLEDLTLLSAILYLDYGDNFAGGVMQGADINAGNLFSHAVGGGANINGPKLTNNTGAAFADSASLMLTSFSSFYAGIGKAATEIAQWREAITAMVRRVYAPFDVTVIDLTTAGATVNGKTVSASADFDDVSETLAASGGHDSYVFIAQAIIDGTTADDATDPTQFKKNGYGGKASALDIGEKNDHIGTALSLLRADYGVNKVAQTIAHEAGHLFGMAHAWRGDQGESPDPRDSLGDYKDQLDLYHRFETMSYLAFSGLSGFSRVPITADKVLDGSDWVANLDPAVLNTTPNPYEHFKADPNVGVSDIEYVTGTGAHDIITIVRTGATTARVTVQPFFDTTYATAINIPGQATATYTYSINTDRPILIDGGSGTDRFVIDGDLGASVTIRGDSWSNERDKDDTLVVLGKGAANGVYIPGVNDERNEAGGTDLRGRIVIGTTIIDFLEFGGGGGVTVSNVQNFVFQTPAGPVGGSGGNVLTVDNPDAGRNRVGRFGSTSGVDVVPLTFFDVANFTIDTATNNASSPNDLIVLEGPGLVAAGLRNFTVNTGDGDDTLVIEAAANFALPVPGGAFTYNAGPQTTPDGDNLLLHGGGANSGQFRPDGATPWAGRFIKDGTTLFATSLERAEVDGFAEFALIAPNDGDDMTVAPLGGFKNRITGSSGDIAFSALSFFNTTNFLIDSRSNNPGGLLGDRYFINNPGGAALIASGLRNFTIQSSAGNDVLTVHARDFRLPASGGEFLFDAGTGLYPPPYVRPGSNLRGLISLDRIVIVADVDFVMEDVGVAEEDWTFPETWARIAPAGSGQAWMAPLGFIRLIGVEGASLTGGASNNRMDGLRFSGTLFLDGGDGDDTLIGGAGDNELVAGSGDDLMIVGRDVFTTPGPGSQHQVIPRSGGRNVLHGGPGRNTFRVDFNGSAVLLGGTGENVYEVVNQFGGLLDPVAGITIVGDGPLNTLNLIDGGGPTYNQIYLLGPTPGSGNIVTTNNHPPFGPTVSQFIRFSGIDSIIDAIAADMMAVLGKSASSPVGGITGDNLAAGTLNPTVGGLPFGEITFSNKANPLFQRLDGEIIRPTPPPSPAPAPVKVAIPTPPPPAIVPIVAAPAAVPIVAAPAAVPIVAAPAVVAAAPTAPAPVVETTVRPGPVRPLARRPAFAGRSLAARRLVKPAAPRPVAPRPALAARAGRPIAFAPRGPMAHLRRA